MPPAIRVENLSKCYRIDHAIQRGSYRTLRESLMEGASSALRKWRGRGSDGRTEEFWALKGVDFEVQPGEVAGIIGRNGAGKSTLLKILSRITEPTEGRVRTRGRVGSLLEVGTGFHPELSGRENIYLSGAILGMARRDISRKFEEIVAFAEIDQFLYTPVKRYSSGMYVRLAFAVAAHLEPEVLIVDEVLAVGDATYQKRCIDRMSVLAASGLTVLFVSHNMELIPRLCQTAILLEGGRVQDKGPAFAVVERYLRGMIREEKEEDLTGKPRTGDGRARFRKIEIVGPDGEARPNHPSGDDLTLRITIEAARDLPDAAIAINLRTLFGTRIFSGWTREAGFRVDIKAGEQTLECRFKGARVRPGQRLAIELWMESGAVIDHVENALILEVIDGPGAERFSTDNDQGVVLLDYEWTRTEHATSS